MKFANTFLASDAVSKYVRDFSMLRLCFFKYDFSLDDDSVSVCLNFERASWKENYALMLTFMSSYDFM